MKKKLREIKCSRPSMQLEARTHLDFHKASISMEIDTHGIKHLDLDRAKLMVEVDVPETFKEFCQLHGVKGKRVVEWMNENYKQIIHDINE